MQSDMPEQGCDSFDLASRALEAMRQGSMTAHPRAFEVWYAHIEGNNPRLSSEIENRLRHAPRLTDAEIEALHDLHLGNQRMIRQSERSSLSVVSEIDSVMSMLDKALGSSTQYGESLTALSNDLVHAKDREQVRGIVESMVRATNQAASDTRSLEVRLAESRSEISELREALERTRAEALTDPLTGLANRRHFDEMLQKLIDQSTIRREPFALVMIDIDYFKRFNDLHGHQTGDLVLRLVAKTMRQKFKTTAICARYGGEEFAVLLPHADIVAGRIGAETMRQALLSRELVKKSTGESLGRITISLGVASFQRGDTPGSLIERSDNCLLAAKRAGRNRTVVDLAPADVSEVA